MTIPRRLALSAVLPALLLCLAARPVAEDLPRPLPELRPFLDDVRQRLRGDASLLDQYTFTEKHTERQFDSKGGVKKTRSEVFEVYPSFEPGHAYRKLVARDGQPLTARELEKEDRKHEAKLEEQQRKLASEGGDANAGRLAKEAEARGREEAIVQEVFRVYDISIEGREDLDGRSTILLAFQPRPSLRPTGRGGKILKKFAGRAWIDEEDRQLVRLEAELIDSLSFGLGILARLHKGARAYFQRRRVNDEIWLPAEARFTGSARLLLFKGLRIDALSEYSDYKKFTVATSADYAPEKIPH